MTPYQHELVREVGNDEEGNSKEEKFHTWKLIFVWITQQRLELLLV